MCLQFTTDAVTMIVLFADSPSDYSLTPSRSSRSSHASSGISSRSSCNSCGSADFYVRESDFDADISQVCKVSRHAASYGT